MPELYLHIGTQKTGSSSIQAGLYKNRDRLIKLGYLYPSLERVDAFEGKDPELTTYRKNHLWLAWTIAGETSYLTESELKKFRSILLSAKKKVILSAEDFYLNRSEITSRVVGDKTRASEEMRASNAERYEENVSRIKGYFDGLDTKIVLYVRKQSDFLESLYREYVKIDRVSVQDAQAFYTERKAIFAYRERIEIWEKHFGASNIIVRPFESAQWKGNLFHDFLRAIGITDVEGFDEPKELNVQFPEELIQMKRVCNDLGISNTELSAIQKFMANVSPAFRTDPIRQDSSAFVSNELRSVIDEEHEAENQFVAKRYLDRENVPLFSPKAIGATERQILEYGEIEVSSVVRIMMLMYLDLLRRTQAQ